MCFAVFCGDSTVVYVQSADTSCSRFPAALPHTSAKAISLREQANKSGVFPTLRSFGITDSIPPYVERLSEISIIDELTLSVRSSNGLKRAGTHTFGKIFDLMQLENGIKSVRNLGEKSVREIAKAFCEECYLQLLPYEKAVYWQQVLDKNNILC